jgi:hypothetical protein
MACLSLPPESQASDASECREIKANNDLFRATIGILCSKNGWQIIEHTPCVQKFGVKQYNEQHELWQT